MERGFGMIVARHEGPDSGKGAPTPRRVLRDRAQLAVLSFWGLLGGLLLVRIAAVYTESINWDEFALLARAADTARTGELHGGGRPGVASLLLVPMVDGCTLATDAIRSARFVWTLFTVALVAGVWFLVRSALGAIREYWHAAALAVGLLALAPAFIRWSIQIRTDQPSLAFGLWGGVLLVHSRKSFPWAVGAGLLFGFGFLFSQKLIYVAALTVLVAAGETLHSGRLSVGRELSRLVLCLVSAVGLVLLYDRAVSAFWSAPALTTIGGGLRTFDFYRETVGFSVYLGMLPTLLPHLALVAVILVAAVGAWRGNGRILRGFLLPIAILALGAGVMVFHAGAFPYFWMTLGLFPALAVALALPTLRTALPPRILHPLLGLAWMVLVLGAVSAAMGTLNDSQEVQRESLAFIERNFDPEQHGFHPERALFCRSDPEPFETYFTQVIRARFEGADGAAERDNLLQQFASKPVYFVVDSWRLSQFPEDVRSLIASSYVPYAWAVMVPGQEIVAAAVQAQEARLTVPGTYRWWGRDGVSVPDLLLDDQQLAEGDTVSLEPGTYAAALATAGAAGLLTLVLEDPPASRVEPFYGGITLEEFAGFPPRWARRLLRLPEP